MSEDKEMRELAPKWHAACDEAFAGNRALPTRVELEQEMLDTMIRRIFKPLIQAAVDDAVEKIKSLRG